MPRDDIIAGLKNAIERGYVIEKAKQTFISAGYSREEVEEASRFVHTGTFSTMSNSSYQKGIQSPISSLKSSILPIKETIFSKLKRNWKVVLLVGILVVLLGLLATTIIFKETILGWFS